MAKNKSKWQPPDIDGQAITGQVYKTYNTKHTTKAEAARDFKRSYGQDPEYVFFGKPNGSLIYAGPVPGTGFIKPDPGQQPQQLELLKG